MKHYILFLFALLPFLSFGQCIIEATERGAAIYVPIDEVAYVNPSGSGSVIVRQSGLRQINASEPLDTIVSRCSPSLFRFTNSSDGRLIAVSKTFIDRIVINGNGKAVIQTKNARIAYISFEDADDLNADIIACYGEGGAGEDGNGIYSGSGTLLAGDTTTVTTLSGSALKVGNTIQSPTEITTIHDANHWGTYNGWDRHAYSFGGFSGYYFIRGNGTAASKTALNVNDVMHEWAFIGQKSPTEDNYALIMRPTIDEITGGNNWGRLDFQGADFDTWLSLRRTGIRAGTASNYTTFPALRPVGSNQLWQYNTDGTGQYTTPGAMVVTNPVGGTNTLQASLDSIYDPCTVSRIETIPDASVWISRTAADGISSGWYSVAYGNGLFVAVAAFGTNRVMTSPDGITWTVRTAPASGWRSVVYGNGLFVAVASSGTNRVMTSPDGITWTARTAAQANDWYSVTYGNGLFVAVALNGTNRVMTSTDGITWTARTAAQANDWYAVTYGSGLFVAVAYFSGTNKVMTSPDGITWTARTHPAGFWAAVEYGDGLFVAAGLGGSAMTSPDGITWTARTIPGECDVADIIYGNNMFVAVAVSADNRVATSSDGITWTVHAAAQQNNWFSITYGDGTYVAVSFDGDNRVMTSGVQSVTVCPTNPYGGDDTMQGIIDSIFQNSNQIIVAADSFYINDMSQPVYVVSAGDTITFPSAAEYTAGSGIDISIGGIISATDNSVTNELQTLSIAGNNLTLSNGGGTVALPSSTWLKPELEVGNVSINSGNRTLTFQRTPDAVQSAIMTTHPNATLGQKYLILKDSSANDKLDFYLTSTDGYVFSNPTGKGLTIEGAAAQVTIRGTDASNSANIEMKSKSGFFTTVQASDSTTAHTTIVLPKTLGTSGQVLTNKGSGITAWEDNATETGIGLLEKSGTTTVTGLTTTYQELCFSDISIAENVGIGDCVIEGYKGITNNTGRGRYARVNFQAGLLQVSGSEQRIFARFYVNGAPTAVRASDGVFSSNSLYSSVANNTIVYVPNGGEVTVRVAKQSSGSISCDFYDMSFSLNFID